MVDNINKNTIGETDAKIKLNALNKLKNAKIKNKSLSSNQEELLKLFADLLKTISKNNYNHTNHNSNNNNHSNNKENESEKNNENDNDNESEGDNENESKDESEDKIKQLNGYFKMIDEIKLFEKQINLF